MRPRGLALWGPRKGQRQERKSLHVNQWDTAPSGQWVLTPSPLGTCPSQGCWEQDFLFKSRTRVAHCQPHLVTSLPDLFLSLSQVRGLVWEGSQVSQALLQTQRSQGGAWRCRKNSPLRFAQLRRSHWEFPTPGPRTPVIKHVCTHMHICTPALPSSLFSNHNTTRTAFWELETPWKGK